MANVAEQAPLLFQPLNRHQDMFGHLEFQDLPYEGQGDWSSQAFFDIPQDHPAVPQVTESRPPAKDQRTVEGGRLPNGPTNPQAQAVDHITTTLHHGPEDSTLLAENHDKVRRRTEG